MENYKSVIKAILSLCVCLVPLCSKQAYSAAEEVGYYMAPVFIVNDGGPVINGVATPALWSVRQEGSAFWVVRSIINPAQNQTIANIGASSTWQHFGNQLPSDVTALPNSIFVHSSGLIFIAEAAVACKSARIFKMAADGTITTIWKMDPTATILPWGWAEDNTGNLFAGFYGLEETDVTCHHNQPANVSNIIQIVWHKPILGSDGKQQKDSDGNLLVAVTAEVTQTVYPTNPNDIPGWFANQRAHTSRWNWGQDSGCNPTFCYPTTSYPNAPQTPTPLAFGSWTAQLGVTANLHIHNLRFDSNKNKFFINAGDSPRATMSWDGNLEKPPSVVVDTLQTNNLLMGFTGATSNSSGVYVGDDWTQCPQGSGLTNCRGNSIRFMAWDSVSVNLQNVAFDTLNKPTAIFTLPDVYDTPVWDLHASGQNELWFVNYDEGLSGRQSTLQKLTRTTDNNWVVSDLSYPPVYASQYCHGSTYYCAFSSWRNNQYIAADRFGKIPEQSVLPYIFLYSLHLTELGAIDYTVISRVSRQ